MLNKIKIRGIVVVFFVFIFAFVGIAISDGPLIVADNNYKCFAETHPNEAKILDARKLGEIKIGEIGLKYRVMAECRQDMPDYILWVQFIDSAKIDEQFDNTANYSFYIMVKNGKVTSVRRSVMIAINDIVDHCLRNKLKIKDFMHTAPKIVKKSGLTI